jgi:outer membrane murein-binding lipoprotein Lpp
MVVLRITSLMAVILTGWFGLGCKTVVKQDQAASEVQGLAAKSTGYANASQVRTAFAKASRIDAGQRVIEDGSVWDCWTFWSNEQNGIGSSKYRFNLLSDGSISKSLFSAGTWVENNDGHAIDSFMTGFIVDKWSDVGLIFAMDSNGRSLNANYKSRDKFFESNNLQWLEDVRHYSQFGGASQLLIERMAVKDGGSDVVPLSDFVKDQSVGKSLRAYQYNVCSKSR